MEYTCTVQCTNTPINPFIHIQKTCIETHRSLPLCEQRTKQNSKLCTILRLFLAHSFLFDNFRVLIVFGMPYSLGSNESSTERDDDDDGSDGDDGNAYIWNMVEPLSWLLLFSTQCYYIIDSTNTWSHIGLCLVYIIETKQNGTKWREEEKKRSSMLQTHTLARVYSARYFSTVSVSTWLSV